MIRKSRRLYVKALEKSPPRDSLLVAYRLLHRRLPFIPSESLPSSSIFPRSVLQENPGNPISDSRARFTRRRRHRRRRRRRKGWNREGRRGLLVFGGWQREENSGQVYEQPSVMSVTQSVFPRFLRLV